LDGVFMTLQPSEDFAPVTIADMHDNCAYC